MSPRFLLTRSMNRRFARRNVANAATATTAKPGCRTLSSRDATVITAAILAIRCTHEKFS